MSWSFQPIMNSYLAVALLAAALVLSLLVRPSYRNLRPAHRRTLLWLRIGVVLLVVLAMLRPTHISTQSKPQTASLLVLFDQTRSMELPNASGNVSRWKAQLETLRQAESLLKKLGEDFEVKVYPYSDSLSESIWQDGQLRLPSAAEGQQTDIGSSLHEAVVREKGKRLVGVLLLGDGTQTAYQPRVEIYDAARELANLDAPLYTVVYGPAGDAAQARDVAIENLPEQFTVFVKNELVVRGLVRVRGYVNKELPLRLLVENSAGDVETIGPVQVRATEDNEQLNVSLTYVPQSPGQYKLTLQADEQAGELVTKNNQLTAFLTVLEGGLRVLYLEGEPRQEQKFVRWALDASPDIDLDFQWLPRRLRDGWPVDLGDTFERGDYDAYILGDVDSAALGKNGLGELAKEIELGKGIVAIGGFHSFGPGGYRNTALADVLPITMDRFARQDFGQPDELRWHVPGPLQMLPTRPHPVTELAAGPENDQVWRELKPLKGANRWAGVKEAPGVQLLANAPDGTPLLVAGEYGKGRVLAFAGDSTWQWWRQGQQSVHKRFWRQVALWLAQRDDLTRQDVWIDLPQRRFPVNSELEFRAGVKSATGDVLRDVSVTGHLVAPSGQRTSLALTRDGDQFAGKIDRLATPGNWRLEVTATEIDGPSLGSAAASFEVMDQDVELSNPAADPDQMQRLAVLTSDAGGKAIAPEQLPDLLKQIQENPPELVQEVLTRWQLGDTWWDAWIVLLALVTLLGGEWFLRKKWGLV
jgi:uncharacterized membrane protein